MLPRYISLDIGGGNKQLSELSNLPPLNGASLGYLTSLLPVYVLSTVDAMAKRTQLLDVRTTGRLPACKAALSC